MEIKLNRYFNEISGIRRIDHEGNNLLYEVLSEGESFLLKIYSSAEEDGWNRGETEFNALSYLWEKGFREIPKAIRFYDEDNIGIYSFEKERVLKSDEIGRKEIIMLAKFIGKLHNLELEDKEKFDRERTSCLSILDYIKMLKTRFYRIQENFSGNDEDWVFLNKEVFLKINEIEKKFIGGDLSKELSFDEQVLTLGDFGFHNAIYSESGFKFVDFEYFGRDDPVKEILVFLHHDKNRGLDKELKELFLEEYGRIRGLGESFYERLKLLDVVGGMNWVLIYLNVLSKKYLDRLGIDGFRKKEVIRERIEKAKEKLECLNFFDS